MRESSDCSSGYRQVRASETKEQRRRSRRRQRWSSMAVQPPKLTAAAVATWRWFVSRFDEISGKPVSLFYFLKIKDDDGFLLSMMLMICCCWLG
ncbi:hypothetical protein Hanom_Chr11g01031041 [Helianthus anomalus]